MLLLIGFSESCVLKDCLTTNRLEIFGCAKNTALYFFAFRTRRLIEQLFGGCVAMMTIFATVVCAIAIVGGFRAIKLGIRGINRLFDWLEDLF